MKKLKAELINLCIKLVDTKLETIKMAMAQAREGANNETKSSAGDKHETGRAMMQFEQEKLSQQLLEVEKMKDQLAKINFEIVSETIRMGSLVVTNKGNYFLAVALSKIEIEKQTVFIISHQAPLATHLLGKKLNDTFVFNQQSFQILGIY